MCFYEVHPDCVLLEFINIRKTELRRTACITPFTDPQHTCIKGINSAHLHHLDLSSKYHVRNEEEEEEERTGRAAQSYIPAPGEVKAGASRVPGSIRQIVTLNLQKTIYLSMNIIVLLTITTN